MGGEGHTAEHCTVTEAHATIQCVTVAGSGSGHTWRVYVESGSDTNKVKQWSVVMAATNAAATTSYMPPSIR